MPEAHAIFPNRPTASLVARAQRALGMTHRQFGEALRSSERTAQRWAQGRSSMTILHLRRLPALVYPKDAALAQEIAEACSETLVSLGIVVPPPAPPALPQRATLAPQHVANLVVLAAAEALGSAPGPMRAALRAAFATAKELGVSVEEVVGALGEKKS